LGLHAAKDYLRVTPDLVGELFMKLRLAGIALSLFFGGCQPAAPAAPAAPDVKAPQAAAPTNEVGAVAPDVSEPATMAEKITANGGEMKGIVGQVADAGYPMFRIFLLLEDGSEFIALLNNEEGILKDSQTPDDLLNKPVIATIKVVKEANLLRLEANGKKAFEPELTSGEALVIPPSAKTITGTLTGATGGTGDLPGEPKVTASDGTSVIFPQFFEAAVAAQEGKVVTLTYDTYESINISALKVDPQPPAWTKK
jgi:hypothetical protein